MNDYDEDFDRKPSLKVLLDDALGHTMILTLFS